MLTRLIEQHYGLESGPLIDFDNLHKFNDRVPKIVFTHNRWLPYFKKVRDQQECEPYYSSSVLIWVRNPLDTCVSQYFQWLHRSEDENLKLKGWPSRDSGLSLNEFLLHPETGVERLCRELNIWLRESEKISRATVVRYEDMLKDSTNGFNQIVSFFKIGAPRQLIEEAVDFSSFENMRLREVTAKQASSISTLDVANANTSDALKARRAQIGGYLNYLSPLECGYFEKIVASQLSPDFGYSELPEISQFPRREIVN
jgi:alcohol sulfotransferase